MVIAIRIALFLVVVSHAYPRAVSLVGAWLHGYTDALSPATEATTQALKRPSKEPGPSLAIKHSSAKLAACPGPYASNWPMGSTI
jgi:hypothetical protein